MGKDEKLDKGYKINYYSQNTDPSDFLLFQHKRMLTFLFKSFLIELEDMRAANLISEEYFYKRRKEILDQSNNFFREFEEYLLKFNIGYKHENKK